MKTFAPKRILVPCDGFEPSMAALEAAKTLGRRYGSRLDLVYVQEPPVQVMGLEPAEEGLSQPGLLRQWADFKSWRRQRLLDRAAPYPPARLRARTLEGWPPARLGELAQKGKTDLAVMGTHGRAGLARAAFGSVVEAVLRRAGVPVLAVHSRRPGWKPRRILVPYNMTPYAGEALRLAVDLARAWKGSLTLLYVAPPGDARAARLDSGARAFDGLALPPGARLRLRRGQAAQEILKEARAGGYDLLVLSAHRKPLLRDAVLGSTAERILRHGDAPTLCVPTGKSSAADWLVQASSRIY